MSVYERIRRLNENDASVERPRLRGCGVRSECVQDSVNGNKLLVIDYSEVGCSESGLKRSRAMMRV